MNKHQFAALLACSVVPPIIDLIQQNSTESTTECLRMFYHSEVYALLEDEHTKLWHYSPLTLFEMFMSEQTSGKIVFPEEAA